MAEYIEREALIAAFNKSAERMGNIDTPWHISAIETEIEAAPAADVAPVRHGRWESLTECANAGVYCSVCNKKVYKEDYAWSNKRIKMRSNYCPNCGALMDLEGGDGDGR